MGKKFFSKEQCRVIEQAIERAELNCSGEIRVHVARHCEANVLDSAAQTFALLGMQRTKLRNGILFYFAADDHKFAVIGDCGINAKVTNDFWTTISGEIEQQFKKGDFVGGLCNAIERCGELLKQYFPYQSDDENELSNEVSFE